MYFFKKYSEIKKSFVIGHPTTQLNYDLRIFYLFYYFTLAHNFFDNGTLGATRFFIRINSFSFHHRAIFCINIDIS